MPRESFMQMNNSYNLLFVNDTWSVTTSCNNFVKLFIFVVNYESFRPLYIKISMQKINDDDDAI